MEPRLKWNKIIFRIRQWSAVVCGGLRFSDLPGDSKGTCCVKNLRQLTTKVLFQNKWSNGIKWAISPPKCTWKSFHCVRMVHWSVWYWIFFGVWIPVKILICLAHVVCLWLFHWWLMNAVCADVFVEKRGLQLISACGCCRPATPFAMHAAMVDRLCVTGCFKCRKTVRLGLRCSAMLMTHRSMSRGMKPCF